jgi:hypothetical protein
MRYRDFEKLVHQMAAAASEVARRSFALDTIQRLHATALPVIEVEFTESERLRLEEILANLDREPAPMLKKKLHELHDEQCVDPVRAIEFNHLSTDLICAIDNWLDYRITGNPESVVGVAMDMVNAIDFETDEVTHESLSENMFAAPEMVAEHQRQKRMLVGSK